MRIKKKVMITLSQENLDLIDKYAQERFMSRTAFITAACMFYINQERALESSKNMFNLIDALLESDMEIDEKTKKKLEALRTISSDIKTFNLQDAFSGQGETED